VIVCVLRGEGEGGRVGCRKELANQLRELRRHNLVVMMMMMMMMRSHQEESFTYIGGFYQKRREIIGRKTVLQSCQHR